MKLLSNISYTTVIIILLSLFFSCNKERKNAHKTLKPGRIIGTISPSDGAEKLVFFNSGNSAEYTVSPNNLGEFTIELPPNHYYITAKPTRLYNAFSTLAREVGEGETVDIGTVSMKARTLTGNVLYTLDGVSYDCNAPGAYGSYNSPDLSIGAIFGRFEKYTVGIAISIKLDNVNGVGSYILKGTSNSDIRIIENTGLEPRVWSTLKGGNGMVNITDINLSKRTFSGTFTVNAVPENYASGNKTITNGTFTDISY